MGRDAAKKLPVAVKIPPASPDEEKGKRIKEKRESP
jgi:hypothetical protein